MPAKSGKQYRFMQMIANDKESSAVGPSKELAEKFIKETPASKRKLFSKKKDK